MDPSPRNPLTDPADEWLRTIEEYRVRNASRREYLVFYLTDRGLFAELSDLARAAIYAWQHDLQLVVDETRFAYTIDRGWADYFDPLFASSKGIDPSCVREQFEFQPKAQDRVPVRRLQLYRTQELQLGQRQLSGFDEIYRFFQRLLFRLNRRCAEHVREALEALALPEGYCAFHIRRGDKIGDEDFYYPAGVYAEQLPHLESVPAIYVLTDDYAAVEDVRRYTATQGYNARIATLTTQEDRGFDVKKLRRGETFMAGAGGTSAAGGHHYTDEATLRLLTDTAAAVGAARTVATARSFVGAGIRALSDDPSRVSLLLPPRSVRYTHSKLRAGRHILDAYDKVLLIRIGHSGAGFFAYVQYAINQIQYCERHRYLPVVHYDRAYGNHFYDPEVGNDMWSYYFEPVAGYSKADIDAMLADQGDRLGAEDVVQLSDDEILQLCQFDPRSVFHYTYGYWREHQPADPKRWYRDMRRKGHRYVAEYIKIKKGIQDEIDAFHRAHFADKRTLGVHIRGTDMRYAPPVPLERFQSEIARWLDDGFERVFVATDQQQYIEILKDQFGERMVYQDCVRSTDARNPMWLENRSPAEQGKEVLIDAALLARCNYMLKSPSAVSEFAHYIKPTLKSHDLNEHRTEFAGQDYRKAGLGYGDYPNAWDLVGTGPRDRHAISARENWIAPTVRRTSDR